MYGYVSCLKGQWFPFLVVSWSFEISGPALGIPYLKQPPAMRQMQRSYKKIDCRIYKVLREDVYCILLCGFLQRRQHIFLILEKCGR